LKYRLALVGCGHHAERAHLPVLARERDSIQLVAVFDRLEANSLILERLGRHDFNNVQLTALDQAAQSNRALLHNLLDSRLGELDGLILSTPAIARKDYLDWALDRRVPVLIDKPVSVRANVSVDPTAADGIWEDFGDFLNRAGTTPVVVGTQRRYHPLYLQIARHLRDINRETGHSVSFVQVATNDGLWARDHNKFALFDPAQTGGGKLINTGYHLLDLIPWLIRQAPSEKVIATADVYATAMHVSDMTNMSPDRINKGNEINAAVQIVLRDIQNRALCQIQIAALHEGISTRPPPRSTEPDDWETIVSGRTKQEVLSLYQGPLAAVWMRRIAKLSGTNGKELGDRGHAEVILAQNPHIDPAVESIQHTVHDYRDDETAPTREFCRIISGKHPGSSLSPLQDHIIPMKLLAKAYRSLTTGQVGRVSFNAQEWLCPPL